ncbi:MAG TPA: FAD-dependent oxidoreductase [Spirochaetales bacterium]|nr:FAD-dependent oxidoreductase [Spirochaetales bacterium]
MAFALTGTAPCVIRRVSMAGPRTARIALERLEGEFPPWRPGQAAPLRLAAAAAPGGARSFPIASAPHERGRMEFLVKAVDAWTLRFVAALEAGLSADDYALVGRPRGRAWLDGRFGSGADPLVLVAGGSGIAAFLGLLEHLAWADQGRRTALLWWARTRDELAPSRDFTAYAKTFPGFSWAPVLTHDPLWDGEKERPGAELLERLAGPLAAAHTTRWLVSGPPGFAKSVAAALRALGVRGGAVRTGP